MADYGEHTGYTTVVHWVTETYYILFRWCDRCGAVVAHESRHDVWHDTLEARQ